MRFNCLIFFIACSGLCALVNAQNSREVDSLITDLAKYKGNDTAKVKKLVYLAYHISNYNFKTSIGYSNQGLNLSKELNYTKGIISSYNGLADAYWYHSDYDKAQQYYFKAYRLSDSLHDENAIAYSMYNIGWILCIQQHNFKENHYLYKSLAIYEKLNDPAGLLKIYNAMASYYSARYQKNNENRYSDSSILYFNKAIAMAKKTNTTADLGRIYGNLGDLFHQKRDYRSANFYNEKSIAMHYKIQDTTSAMYCMVSMGLCDLESGSPKEAIKKFNTVNDFTVRHDITDNRLMAVQGLAEGFYMLGDYKKAYDYHKQYAEVKEKMDKEMYSTTISNLQGSYSLEKSEGEVEQLKQTNEIQELKNKKNSYFIFILLAVALIVIVAAALLFKQNKQKQLTNVQLQNQNQVIAEKKHEIDNSIQYAKGIQQAILPDEAELAQEFDQSFIYYKPKDVVSGDFYWFSKVGDEFYCIAADCTGHGVPGALMSIIGIDKVVQAVYEKQITVPGKILSFLNLQIKKVLKQHSDASKQKDGMDLALLKFNSKHEVEFSGANRPLYLVRNNELIEYKPDKTAIAGFTTDEQEFATTTISLQKNDSLFIFTDGYADQFGGPEGKKFMSKNLKSLLVSISVLSAKEQHQRIEAAFMDWKKDYEQVDDILVIGIKLS